MSDNKTDAEKYRLSQAAKLIEEFGPKRIRVIVIRVGSDPCIEEIDHTSDGFRAVVGGSVAMVALDDGLDLWHNDNGIAEGLPYNRHFLYVAPERAAFSPFSVIMGPDGKRWSPDDPRLANPGETGAHVIPGDCFIARHKGDLEVSVKDGDLEAVRKIARVVVEAPSSKAPKRKN